MGWPDESGITQSEDVPGVSLEVETGRLRVELERGQVFEGRGGGDHRVVGPEEGLPASGPRAHELHELRREAPGRVGGGVDVDVLVLARDGDHLVRPGVADVPADDDELGEVQGDLVDVGDRPAGLGRAERAGVADLRAEGHPEVDAGRVQRVVATVGRRGVPQPRHDPQALEPEILDAAAQLADRVHGPVQVDCGETGETVGLRGHPPGDLVVGDERLDVRGGPGAQQPEADSRIVHRRRGRGDRKLLVGHLLARPAPQRVEHLMAKESQRRMLHPDVDRHRRTTATGRPCRVTATTSPPSTRAMVSLGETHSCRMPISSAMWSQ